MGNGYEEPSPQAFGSPLERYRKRMSMLNLERSTWLFHWQELNDYIFPRRFRYLQTDRNKGTKKNDKIINNKATVAVRTLGSGMHAGITSPARTWFKLLAPPRFRDDPEAKEWLGQVEKITREGRFADKRSEIWYLMSQAVKSGLCLPGDPELVSELTGPSFFFDQRSKMRLESKDDLKKRGLMSPDKADALALTYAEPVHAEVYAPSYVKHHPQAVTDYNPYEERS